MTDKGRFVVVTTAHRGVFGGYLTAGADDRDKTVELLDAQMCIYWDAGVRGVLGLATDGPNSKSRVGPAVPRIVVQDVTAVVGTTAKAEEAWQKQPW